MTTPAVNFDAKRDDLVSHVASDVAGAPRSSLETVHELLLKRFTNQDIQIYEAGGGSMSGPRHSRPGPASSKFSHGRYALKAESNVRVPVRAHA